MAAKTQDLPPPGGYNPINYKRVLPKSYFKCKMREKWFGRKVLNGVFWDSGKTMIGLHLAISSGAMYLYYLNYKKVERDQVEMRSARHAIMPLLFAERDREYLKQLRRNRDEETKLMANVPGWEVGKLYGEPIFKTLPEDTLVDPSYREYYAHTDYKNAAKRAHQKLWN